MYRDSATTNSLARSGQDPWQEGQDPWSANSSGSNSSGSTFSTTEPKKHSIEDVREQTERTALVPMGMLAGEMTLLLKRR